MPQSKLISSASLSSSFICMLQEISLENCTSCEADKDIIEHSVCVCLRRDGSPDRLRSRHVPSRSALLLKPASKGSSETVTRDHDLCTTREGPEIIPVCATSVDVPPHTRRDSVTSTCQTIAELCQMRYMWTPRSKVRDY